MHNIIKNSLKATVINVMVALLIVIILMFSLHHPDCSAIYQYRCNTIFPVNCQALPPD